MKHMIVGSIVLFFFALAAKALTVEIDTNNYFRLISDVHTYYQTSCIIFVKSDDYHDLNLTTLVHTWSREFSRQSVMSATITFSDLVNEYNRYRKTIVMPLFVVLLDTEKVMSEFSRATRNIKPISFPTWFVMFLQRPGNPLEKYCKYPTDNVFNVDFSSLMLVLCYDHPILVEWYAIRDNQTRTFELATWTADRGLILRTQKSLYARRNDMFGDVMRVAYVTDSPFFSVTNGTINGFLGLLMIELSKVMNFTMQFLDPVKAYGSWSHTQNIWTGVIGQLVSNAADIGVSRFTITPDRLNAVDFTLTLEHAQNRLYFKQPSGSDIQWFGYFKAFGSDIWITLVATIITASILLTVIKAKGFSINIISDSYINVWGIYCQQGLSEFPNKSSMRLAFFFIFFSSLIIMSAYSAALIRFLAFSTVSLPFSTLEGYIKDGSYKLIVVKNSAEVMKNAYRENPVFRKMYELMVNEEELPLTLADGFKQLCERTNYAFYSTTEVLKNAANVSVPCKVVRIEIGITENTALALTKGNPYIGLINYYLQQFRDNGVINKLKYKYFLKNNSPVTNYDAVKLNDIAPTLMIMIGGIMLALCVLLIERTYYTLTARFKNSKSFVKKSSPQFQKINKNNLNNLRLFGYLP